MNSDLHALFDSLSAPAGSAAESSGITAASILSPSGVGQCKLVSVIMNHSYPLLFVSGAVVEWLERSLLMLKAPGPS